MTTPRAVNCLNCGYDLRAHLRDGASAWTCPECGLAMTMAQWRRSQRRPGRIMLGVMIHSGVVLLTCFIVPLAMNSNIWPIAGAFWSVMTVPVAAGTGALTGWMVKNRSAGVAIAALALTGIALAVAVGMIIVNNR